MFITKMALPRRTFLRGLGATIALPLLDAMVPALCRRGARPPPAACRLGFVYVPNGVAMNDGINHWTPQGTGARLRAFADPDAARAVSRSPRRSSAVSRRSRRESLGDGNGEHSRACATWLNGVHPKKTEGADVRLGHDRGPDCGRAVRQGHGCCLSIEMASSEIDHILVGQCENGYSCVY